MSDLRKKEIAKTRFLSFVLAGLSLKISLASATHIVSYIKDDDVSFQEQNGTFCAFTAPGKALNLEGSLEEEEGNSFMACYFSEADRAPLGQLPVYVAEYEDEKFDKRLPARLFDPEVRPLEGLMSLFGASKKTSGWSKALNKTLSQVGQGLSSSGYLPNLEQGVSPVFALEGKEYDGDIGCGPAGSKDRISLKNVRLPVKNQGFSHVAQDMSWENVQITGNGRTLKLSYPETSMYKEVVLNWTGNSDGISVDLNSTGGPVFQLKVCPLHPQIIPSVSFRSSGNPEVHYALQGD